MSTHAAGSFVAGAAAGAGAAALSFAKSMTLTPSPSPPCTKLSRYIFMSDPFNKIVVLELLRWTAWLSVEEASTESRQICKVEGIGVGSGSGDTSSLLVAEGKTSLMRSSEANRNSLSLRNEPRAEDGVSVDSDARRRTGVGVAVLAVFGLNRSYNRHEG